MTATADHTGTVTGRVVRVTGPVVDVEFPRNQVPELYNPHSRCPSRSARSSAR